MREGDAVALNEDGEEGALRHVCRTCVLETYRDRTEIRGSLLMNTYVNWFCYNRIP